MIDILKSKMILFMVLVRIMSILSISTINYIISIKKLEEVSNGPVVAVGESKRHR